METNYTFKEQLFSLCELLGESRSTLTSRLGTSNDISEDENRAFICYPDSHSVFRVMNKRVDRFSIPTADAYGHDYTGPKEYYSLDGITLGMSIEEVKTHWGEPTTQGESFLNYENKLFTNKNGINFQLYISFKEGTDNKYYLKEFGAYIKQIETFETKFIKLCELLGCNEDTIIDNIGKPDASRISGAKFIYYERFKAIFTISSDLHTASYVSAPNSGIEGGALATTDNYFTFQGVKIGDSRSEIQRKWGTPTSQAVYNWTYGNKCGNTKSKNQYEIRISFSTNNPDISSEFEGGIKEVEEQYIQQSAEKSKSGCFVATACYGNYNATEVLVLRNYRDTVLLKTNLGRTAVSVYYRLSPPIARFIEKSELIKTFIRKNILAPIVSKIKQNQ